MNKHSIKRTYFFALLLFFCFSTPTFAKEGETSKNIYAGAFSGSGTASWYGPQFHGKQTANGELYNMYGLTAAHKTLPFGTVLNVTNTKNNKSVLVQVNDRGPYSGKRVIDMSKAAMNILAARTTGIINVKIQAVGDEKGLPLDSNLTFYVRCWKSFSKEDAALELEKLHKVGFFEATIFSFPNQYLVGIGPFKTFQEAQDTLVRIVTLFPLATIDLAPKKHN